MECAVWVQTIVLIITAGSVCWYTWETAKLRREMVRQNEIALRPVLVPEFGRSAQELVLRNIGVGAALNVRIKPLEIFRSSEFGGELVIEFRFTPVAYLASAQTSQIGFERYVDGQRNPGPDAAFRNFLPGHGQSERLMAILFDDAEGGNYGTA